MDWHSHWEHLVISICSPYNVQEWKTIEEEQVLLRELGIRGAVFGPQIPGGTELCSWRSYKVDAGGISRLVWGKLLGFAEPFGG